MTLPCQSRKPSRSVLGP